MRVVLCNNFPIVTGGADRHCFDLADALEGRGHEVRFLTTQGDTCLAGAAVPLTVSRSSREAASLGAQASIAARSVWNRSAYGAMASLIRDFRPDVVHAHKLYPQLSVAPLIAAAHARVAIIQTIHDYEFISAHPEDDGGGRVDRLEARFRYRALNTALFQQKRSRHIPRVDHWVAVSEAVAAKHRPHGIEPTVIPNFIRVSASPPRTPAERAGAVFVGRLTEAKGVGDLIELARLKRGLQIRVIGDGPMRSQVEVAARELGNMTYLGPLEQREVWREIGAAMVCLMPSRWEEPGGLVCLEAMALGTPVICYDVGGLSEYVRNSGGGEVAERGPSGLSLAMERLGTDSARWTRASRSGLQAALGAHSVDTYLPKLEAVYSATSRGAR